jgi:NADPH:quinone reductase-like Zn-dependent oxidoreductase
MKALVYHGPGERGWDTVDDPTIIDPTDAIVRIDTSTICGSDLHILKGDVPETLPGTILGHEAVGTVVEVGSAVSTIAPAIASCCRVSALAGAAAIARRRATVSALVVAAGSSVTRSTDCRPS